MRHQDPVDLIRDRNPVPDAHQLPDGPNSASTEALFEEIIGMEDQKISHIRRPRLGRVTALAAAFLVVSAGAAIAAGVFDPDPADVATIEEAGEEGAAVHFPGWRPALRTEAVWCMYDLSTGAATQVSEFPLGDPLTKDALLAECATGNDVARNQDVPPTEFTLCEGTFTEAEYVNRITQDDRFNIIEGDLTTERPGFPVVLAWEADCTTTTLQTSFAIDLAPMTSLDEVNKARETEIGVKATAIDKCLARPEADALARDTRATLGESWLLLDYNLDGPVDCYRVDIEPDWGVIGVIGLDDANTQQETPTTAPPEDGQ